MSILIALKRSLMENDCQVGILTQSKNLSAKPKSMNT